MVDFQLKLTNILNTTYKDIRILNQNTSKITFISIQKFRRKIPIVTMLYKTRLTLWQMEWSLSLI